MHGSSAAGCRTCPSLAAPVTETPEGLEATFALYYLSRYLLSHELTPALSRSTSPVIINVAGVGIAKGSIQWDDLQLTRRYSMIRAQLQAGRANDLLGVGYAAGHGLWLPKTPYGQVIRGCRLAARHPVRR